MSDEVVEFVETRAGIYFRSVLLPKKGMAIPQHVHDEAHATLCCSGSARMHVDYKRSEDIAAGHAVEVEAGKRHWFEALEDNTRLTCIWTVEAAHRMKGSVWPG
jgi:quercetin dioxygenase-like cupin family protein